MKKLKPSEEIITQEILETFNERLNMLTDLIKLFREQANGLTKACVFVLTSPLFKHADELVELVKKNRKHKSLKLK